MSLIIRELQELQDKMYRNLLSEVSELDGEVTEFSLDDKLVYVTVDPELQECLEGLITDLLLSYEQEKNKILRNDIFGGVKAIINEDVN